MTFIVCVHFNLALGTRDTCSYEINKVLLHNCYNLGSFQRKSSITAQICLVSSNMDTPGPEFVVTSVQWCIGI